MSHVPMNTAVIRSARTHRHFVNAFSATANALDAIAHAIDDITYPDGALRGDKDTVFVEQNAALIAQHQPVGSPTMTGGSGTPTASFTNIDGALLPDAANTGFSSTFPIPAAWRGKRISMYVTWAHSEAATTGNVLLRLDTLPIAVGEDDTGTITQTTQTVTAAASGGDNNDLYQETKMGTISIGGSDRLLHYEFVRRGNNAADTFTAGVWVYTLSFVNDQPHE